jgi:hypothetical protein
LIVAERYGSMGPGGISYTEMEYRYAVEQDVPVAALLLDSARREQWPAGKIDFENRNKLNAFRELCKTRMVSYWSDTGTLTTKCQLALSGLFRKYPRVGWVSGDGAVSPQLASELARLSSENAEFRLQLAQLQRQGAAGKELEITVERLVEPFLTQIQRGSRRYPEVYTNMLKDEAASQLLGNCNLFDLIMMNAEDFFDGVQDDRVYQKMRTYMEKKMNEIQIPRDDFPEKMVGRVCAVMTLLMRSWGLVETFHVDESPQRLRQKWLRLSPLGKRAFQEALDEFLDGTALPSPGSANPS